MINNDESNLRNISIDSTNQKCYKLKIILIGDSGVGKTSLLCRYMGENFDSDKPCTIYADYKIKAIKIDSLTSAEIVIWDTCGQEKYKSMTRQFFKDTQGVILMFDVCDIRSFSNLNKWLEEIPKNSDQEKIPTVLCGNKSDLINRNISYDEAHDFAEENQLLYCETSSKNGINVDSPFELVTKEIIEKMKPRKKTEADFSFSINSSINTSTRAIKGKENKRKKEKGCC